MVVTWIVGDVGEDTWNHLLGDKALRNTIDGG
jgi:hypothetical protein